MSDDAKKKKEAGELKRLAKHPRVSSFFRSQEENSSLQSDMVEIKDTLVPSE